MNLKTKKMTNVNVTKSINVSAIEAWSKLAAFEGIEHFSPIAKSVVEGQGVGAKRTCTLPDGAEIKEVLNKLDNDNMHLEYEILTGPFPISNYVSNVIVKDKGSNNCEVSWGCNFNVDASAESEMKSTFEGFYNVIIDSLETLIKAN